MGAAASPGRVRGLAYRPEPGAPMVPVERGDALTGAGFAGERGRSARRGLTFLARDRWEEACREVGARLPWFERRANVLVEGLDLLPLVGRRLRLGQVVVEVTGETRPCARMEALHPGLEAALGPEGRGGVHARVLTGGALAVGETVEVLGEEMP